MYFVEREKIEQTLTYMDELLNEIKNDLPSSRIEKLGLERVAQMTVDAILDTGNLMIDGFIMRDPGGFDDIIDILIDEKVLPPSEETAYKSMIQLRKQVINGYLTIDYQVIHNKLLENKSVLQAFSTHIRDYLDNELGVANAFSNS